MNTLRRRIMGAGSGDNPLFQTAYAYYPFNGDLNDYSGNGRNITDRGNVNVYNDSVMVTTSRGYLHCPWTVSPVYPTTISVTFDYETVSSIQYPFLLIGNTSSSWQSYSLGIESNPDTLLIYYCSNPTYTTYTLSSRGKINVTLRRTSANLSLFVDGVKVKETTINNNYSFNNKDMYIGNRINKDRGYVDKKIYGFVYFESALTDSEIASIAKDLR